MTRDEAAERDRVVSPDTEEARSRTVTSAGTYGLPEDSADKNRSIVLSAFAANPEMSSETGIGWIYIKKALEVLSGARERSTVLIVCNHRSKLAIEPPIRNLFPDLDIEVIGVSMPRGLKWLERRPTLTRLEYVLWHVISVRLLKRKTRGQFITLAQHVTFATEVLPTPISRLENSAFRVWGPVGAAGDIEVYNVTPETQWSQSERRTHYIRDRIADRTASCFGKGIDLAVAQNDSVAARFAKAGISTVVFPNVVIRDDLRALASEDLVTARQSNNVKLRILCVGHLIARKRFEIAIAALAQPGLEDATVEFLGRPLPGSPHYLPEIAEKYGVAERVIFRGKVSRQEVLLAMREADVLFHPSAREGASGVVGEATTVGIPVVCFESTGASSVLAASGSSGIAIDAKSTSLSEIASTLRAAAQLPRRPSLMWTEDRFAEFFASLLSDASRRHAGQAPRGITK